MNLDPDKVEAILQLLPPANVQEVTPGKLVNYLGKYIPNISTVGQPLYKVLKKMHGHGDTDSKQPLNI